MKRRNFLEQMTKAAVGAFAFTPLARKAVFVAAIAETTKAVAQTIPVVAFRNRRPLLGVNGSTVVTSQDGMNYKSGTDLPTIKSTIGNYSGIAYLGGTYCISTDCNGVVTSTNLTSWTLQTVPIVNSSTIAASGSLFLLCDRSSTATATSTNGITWISRTGLLNGVTSFVWAGTQFFATDGTNGATSPDGITWTARTLPAPMYGWASAVWNGSKICLLDEVGQVASSADGITWATAAFDTGNTYHYIVAYGTKFAALGSNATKLAISSDGVTWTFTTSNVPLQSIGSSGSLLLGLNYCAVYTSSDAITFTSRSTATGFWLFGATVNAVDFVLGIGVSTNLTSTNLTTWTTMTMPVVYAIPNNVTLARSKSTIVAIANQLPSQSVLTSTNQGLTWSVSYSALPTNTNWGSIVYNGSVFVAIAGNNATSTAAAYSSDGLTWTAATLPASRYWSALTWNGTYFIAVASGSTSAATSPNGVTWTARTLPSSNPWILGASNFNTAVVVNSIGTNALYSSNGTTFTSVTLPVSDNWANVVWNGTYYVLLGESGNILTSPTGLVWTQHTIPASTYLSLAYNGAYLIAIDFVNNIPVISNDGLTWTPVSGNTSPTGTLSQFILL